MKYWIVITLILVFLIWSIGSQKNDKSRFHKELININSEVWEELRDEVSEVSADEFDLKEGMIKRLNLTVSEGFSHGLQEIGDSKLYSAKRIDRSTFSDTFEILFIFSSGSSEGSVKDFKSHYNKAVQIDDGIFYLKSEMSR